MRPGVESSATAGRQHHRDRGEAEHDEGQAEDGQHGHLHLVASIFLPRYSGVRPTISPAMNTATMANTSMP